MLGGALVLGALALAIVFNDELFDAGVVAFGAAYFLVMLGGPVLAAAVAGASDSYASRVLPSVEFLPDSGESQWDQGSSRRRFLAGFVIAGLALLVAIAQLLFDIA